MRFVLGPATADSWVCIETPGVKVMTPSLYDTLPTAPARRCPRCRKRKPGLGPACLRCGAMLATEVQWAAFDRWMTDNAPMLRKAVAGVRADLARRLDDAEIVSLCRVVVMRAAMRFDGAMGGKFGSYVYRAVRWAALREPHDDAAAGVIEWDRVAG